MENAVEVSPLPDRLIPAFNLMNAALAIQGSIALFAKHHKTGRLVQKFYPRNSLRRAIMDGMELSKLGYDAYWGVNTYDEVGKRAQEHVTAVKTLKVDIDVDATGKNKEKYHSKEEAEIEIQHFCRKVIGGEPTLVDSGGGLHVYVLLDTPLAPAEARAAVSKFERLLDWYDIKVDRQVTADSARVLRIPGTMNFKYDPPSSVKLLTTPELFSTSAVLASLEDACEKLPPTVQATAQGNDAPDNLLLPSQTNPLSAIPYSERNLRIIEDMLACVDADNGRKDGGNRERWRSIVFSIASLDWGDAGQQIARDWSQTKGSLWDERDFIGVWNSYNPTRTNKCTIGTLVHHARDNGYNGEIPSSIPDMFQHAETYTPPASGNGDEANEYPNEIATERWLDDMNQRYAYIQNPSAIYSIKYRCFTRTEGFRTEFDNRQVQTRIGSMPKNMGMGSAWLKHPGRRTHTEVTLIPGGPKVTKDGALNTWAGFEHPPVEGDVQPFLDLMHRLFPGSEEYQYVLHWIAHLIQRPDIKMNVALVVWSRMQGVGKNLLFETLSELIGRAHSTKITQTDLHSTYNDWISDKIFVIGDEVIGSDKRSDADRLKDLITGTTVYINRKYVAQREVRNLANFVFLSNHPNAVHMDEDDRRYFVVEVKASKLPDEVSAKYVNWKESGGLAALHHYLLSVGLNKFNPKSAAPLTTAKREMIEDSKSDFERWADEVMTGDPILLLGKEITRAEELADRYRCDRGVGVSAKTVTSVFVKLGALKSRTSLRTSNGKKVRMLALRNQKCWKTASESEWVKEYEKRQPLGGAAVVLPANHTFQLTLFEGEPGVGVLQH